MIRPSLIRLPALLLAFLTIATLFAAIAPGAKPPPAPTVPFHYHVQYVLLPGETWSTAGDLNDWGDVVGTSGDRPFYYDSVSGTVVDLRTVLDPSLNVFIDEVAAINNARQIAGQGHDANGDRLIYRLQAPALAGDPWTVETVNDTGGLRHLDQIGGVAALNDDGDVLFTSSIYDETTDTHEWFKVIVWEGGATAAVETSRVHPSAGMEKGLSNRDGAGQIAFVAGGGDGGNPGEETGKYVYQTGSDPSVVANLTRIPIGSLGTGRNHPTAINPIGHVAGEAQTSGKPANNAPWHAFVQTGGPTTIKDLGILGGKDSAATSLNNVGDMIGLSETGEKGLLGTYIDNAMIFTGGKMYDLRTLVDDSGDGIRDELKALADINDSKTILGTRDTRSGLPPRAYVLLKY